MDYLTHLAWHAPQALRYDSIWYGGDDGTRPGRPSSEPTPRRWRVRPLVLRGRLTRTPRRRVAEVGS
jgi:hypothetical protein